MFPIIPQKVSAENLNCVASDLLVQVNLKYMHQRLETATSSTDIIIASHNIPIGVRSDIWLVRDMCNLEEPAKVSKNYKNILLVKTYNLLIG